jgi:outer membrane protein TolC
MLKTMFGPGAAMYTLAAGATQPIFEGGTLLGQLDLQKGTREELLQDYRMAVISAFTDVEKALVADPADHTPGAIAARIGGRIATCLRSLT